MKNFKPKECKESDKKVLMKYEVKQTKALETNKLKYEIDNAIE
jgi:hypothetical protein